ncbi:MAG: macro domain-containing protein [Candidatus Atribacteria bacterium]|nr:macro domain-containing protein [Candidatus Atribacteria bacterium]
MADNLKVLVGKNIFDSQAQTLVNTVNCVGVMGKGLALEFKKRFPQMYEDYVERCQRKELKIGQPYLYTASKPWILNFPTKYHWRQGSKRDYIEKGLQYLLEHYREWGIESLAVPPLGCGEGGLAWEVIGPIIEWYLSRMDIPVELYAPYDLSSREEFALSYPIRGRISPGMVILLSLFHCLGEQSQDVTAEFLQYIAYLAWAFGLPVDFPFRWENGVLKVEKFKTILGQCVNNGLLAKAKDKQKNRTVFRPAPELRSFLERYPHLFMSQVEQLASFLMGRTGEDVRSASLLVFIARQLAQRFGRSPSREEIIDEFTRRNSDFFLRGEKLALLFDDLVSVGLLSRDKGS